jgi:adenosylcobinamide-GDP ribazoletransferase
MGIYVNQRLKDVLTPCLMAIALLTRLPVTQQLPEKWSDKALGQSALWYPFVGLLLVCLLFLLTMFVPSQTAPLLLGGLIVIIWVLLTGGLHLDGLADSIDAMYAGHAVVAVKEKDENKENKPLSDSDICPKKQALLRVLKDPNIGAMGAIALVLLLLLKVSVLSVSSQLLLSLLVAMVVSRSIALLFIVSTPYTPYVSQAGLGAVLAASTPKTASIVVLTVVFFGLFTVLSVNDVCILLSVQLVLFYSWRRYWVKHLGGFVGDSIGALIELSEVSLLLTLYFLFL